MLQLHKLSIRIATNNELENIQQALTSNTGKFQAWFQFEKQKHEIINKHSSFPTSNV
jgi:hypothetical protein